MTHNESHRGHRARLRERFSSNPASLTDAELMELLLIFAIPRRDAAPLANRLVTHFGTLNAALAAPISSLVSVNGIGEHAAVLLRLVGWLRHMAAMPTTSEEPDVQQLELFQMEPSLGPLFEQQTEPVEPAMRTFANDEFANSLLFIPRAAHFESYDDFKAHLRQRLPYNSESTRERRAHYILNRFFPQERLDVPLAYYASRCGSEADLQPVLFYHVLKAEPLAAAVAEELVWPALPLGRVERDAVREFVLQRLPDIRPASQTKVLQSLFNTYDLSSTGTRDESLLRFQSHPGTFQAFLYVLTAEFPEPGMYRFEQMEEGSMRHWLLWDREWMVEQLYNLRDVGVLSKVSQIDALRQFTLQHGQWDSLRLYFQNPRRDALVLREDS